MENTSYNDVMAMPTRHRRHFLNLLNRDIHRKVEMHEAQQEKTSTSTGKNSRTTKVSGGQLKSMMESGKIPLI